MRVLVQHRSIYEYPKPAGLGAHAIRLRPADHARAHIESYRFRVEPDNRTYWQRDPHGNHVARIVFPITSRFEAVRFSVELVVDVRPVNPFDFLLDPRANQTPFEYPDELGRELSAFLDLDEPAYAGGPNTDAFLAELPREGPTVELITKLCQAVNQRLRYVIREEPGIWTPEQSLEEGRASCRDSAVLLVRALRSRGFAARFASGYLIQLRDEGMIPDEPKGVDHDVVDLHAWAEVYLPGAGWIGLDATSGLLCGEGHIPLACSSSPKHAAPITGTTDTTASAVRFETAVERLGHETRPTTPYTDAQWEELLAASDRVDDALERSGLMLTLGGEPTFCSREEPEADEWNSKALGPGKWRQGVRLAAQLQQQLAPGGIVLQRMGKQYPGETLPRWSLDICGRADGAPLVPPASIAGATSTAIANADAAERLARSIAETLGLPIDPIPAFEDPLAVIKDEAMLPPSADPRKANVSDPEERRRLARILAQGVDVPTGYVLPVARNADDSAWLTERWRLRRDRLYLLPGDSPLGLRLPLASLDEAPAVVSTKTRQEIDPRSIEIDDAYDMPDPPEDPVERAKWAITRGRKQLRIDASDASRAKLFAQHPELQWIGGQAMSADAPGAITPGVRTALAVEARDGKLWVFLPPVLDAATWLRLLDAIGRAAESVGVTVAFEGYPPPSSPLLSRFSVTPDPGVLEVNIPPIRRGRDHAALMHVLFDAAQRSGLHAEKYLNDGRMTGSGGGHHLTMGGPTPESSPFFERPKLLAGLIALCQRHPSLSYLFTGLFVGPTSQAPRLDEARQEVLAEVELALARATAEPKPPPWLLDALFRHLLVDVSGSTHRTELCIDKLYDPHTHHGRQGLLEMRAFEMPPHPQLATAQAVLVRALVCAVDRAPVPARLVRWGAALHDRYLLPYFLWQDFEEVLAFLASAGITLDAAAYRPFLDLRCPVVGRHEAEGLSLELRNALEPWNVLGEQALETGTSRFVDSSVERVEVLARGLDAQRHRVVVNGLMLDTHATVDPLARVAGVRFRAWCPPNALAPHIGVHHPLRFDVVDIWARRSVLSLGYHVWHPEGRAHDSPPLTRFEASARRSQRVTVEGAALWPIHVRRVEPDPERPCSLDLRRASLGTNIPSPDDWPTE